MKIVKILLVSFAFSSLSAHATVCEKDLLAGRTGEVIASSPRLTLLYVLSRLLPARGFAHHTMDSRYVPGLMRRAIEQGRREELNPHWLEDIRLQARGVRILHGLSTQFSHPAMQIFLADFADNLDDLESWGRQARPRINNDFYELENRYDANRDMLELAFEDKRSRSSVLLVIKKNLGFSLPADAITADDQWHDGVEKIESAKK